MMFLLPDLLMLSRVPATEALRDTPVSENN
jgi:hypothetical protein